MRLRPVTSEEYERILRDLTLGSPIAEDDDLLAVARVETPTFSELLRDRIDVVRGTKGSGKTALFRILTSFVSEVLFENRRTVMLAGVEATGDPVFARFKAQFEQLTDLEFQNFWRIYFLSLVNSKLIQGNRRLEGELEPARAEIAAYFRLAAKHGFPVPGGPMSQQGLVGWVLARLPRRGKLRLEGGVDPLSGAPTGAVEIQAERDGEEQHAPIFIAELNDALIRILDRVDLNVWVMLDRLDEVFERRSHVERTALRGLLRTTLSFRTPRLRPKVFLRDDIFDSVTEADGGFVAMTHVKARTSTVLTWGKDQLKDLVVRRLSANPALKRVFAVEGRLDAEQQDQLFYAVFPERLHSGPNQSRTMDWLFKHCEDGNGVVTPRDFIDLFAFAVREQQSMPVPVPGGPLLSQVAVRTGYQRMCQEKRTSLLKAEFGHFWAHLEKFEGRKADHSPQSLELILGPDWQRVAKDLRSIGFLKFSARHRPTACRMSTGSA